MWAEKKNCPVIENAHFRFTKAAKNRPCLSSLLLLITGGCQSSGYGCAEKNPFHEGGTCPESFEKTEINQQLKSLPIPFMLQIVWRGIQSWGPTSGGPIMISKVLSGLSFVTNEETIAAECRTFYTVTGPETRVCFLSTGKILQKVELLNELNARLLRKISSTWNSLRFRKELTLTRGLQVVECWNSCTQPFWRPH